MHKMLAIHSKAMGLAVLAAENVAGHEPIAEALQDWMVLNEKLGLCYQKQIIHYNDDLELKKIFW